MRTYENTTCEDEIHTCLDNATQFERGPYTVAKATAYDDGSAFVCVDENYLSARWPGGLLNFNQN